MLDFLFDFRRSLKWFALHNPDSYAGVVGKRIEKQAGARRYKTMFNNFVLGFMRPHYDIINMKLGPSISQET